MKFHYGEIKADADFKPAETGWTLAWKPGSMWRTQLAALPVGVAATALALAAWLKYAPPKMPALLVRMTELFTAGVAGLLHAAPWAAKGLFSLVAVWGLSALVFVLLMLAAALPLAVYFLAHEFVHALAAPSFGFTDKSVIGVWPAGGVAYSHYEGEMSRGRWILMLLTPFLTLSVLPFAAAAVAGWHSPYLAALSLVNVVGSYVDLYYAGRLFLKVPAGAFVRLADDGLWFRIKDIGGGGGKLNRP
jgi:hypothetical protein